MSLWGLVDKNMPIFALLAALGMVLSAICFLLYVGKIQPSDPIATGLITGGMATAIGGLSGFITQKPKQQEANTAVLSVKGPDGQQESSDGVASPRA